MTNNGVGSPGSPREALGSLLESLNLPPALLSGVLDSYQSFDSRLVVIDNSSFMKVRDSHVGRIGSGGRVKRVDNVTRWEEMKECVTFHCRLARNSWMPTKFWFLNRPTGATSGDSKKFALCWSTPEEVPNEMSFIKHMMENVTLDKSKCELTSRISHISKIIAKEAPDLLAKDKVIRVILCTQGMPTNGKGQSGTTIRQEFRKEMSSLSKLPVKILVRLCTDDEKVIQMYNDMDDRFDSIDVLDDYWGEAMEVYLHNPWLNYSFGLHRLRESGLAPDVLGGLDERPLTLDEIHQLCLLLFVGEETNVHLPLPPYQPTAAAHLRRASWINSWFPFIMKIDHFLEKEKLQWNPIRKRMMPWIDLKKLQSTLKEQICGESAAHPNAGDPPGESFRSCDPESDAPSRYRDTNSVKSDRHMRPPRASIETTNPKRWQSAREPFSCEGRNSLTLEEVIQQWSHRLPDYKRPHSLQQLLVTVPQTFPPMNTKVEHHTYFSKWKRFDKEAFADVGDDGMKPLLQRALRKAKFFLHPDKLPKDLTKNQTILFKTIWDVVTQQEAATFG